MIGGRKVSELCGMWKVNVFTWRPILESASMRAGFENVEVLKVEVTDSNSCGAARDEKSWQTRRKLARSSDSKWSRRLSRHVSFSQKRKKTELVERTKLQIELLERVACYGQYGSTAHCARGVLHRPSIVVAGVKGISPNNSFELARDVDVTALA
jgi:hypothetical protein